MFTTSRSYSTHLASQLLLKQYHEPVLLTVSLRLVPKVTVGIRRVFYPDQAANVVGEILTVLTKIVVKLRNMN